MWVKRLCISHTSNVVVLRGCKYDDNFHRYQIGIHPRPSLFTQGCNIVLVFKTHTQTHTQSRQTRMKKYHSFTLKQQQLLIIKPTLRRLPYLSILNRNRYYVLSFKIELANCTSKCQIPRFLEKTNAHYLVQNLNRNSPYIVRVRK